MGERSTQRGLFEADHLYMDHVGRDSFYGFLASQRDQMFDDEDFADLYCRDNGRKSVPPSLLATVLHDLVQAGVAGPALKEIARVIKTAGDLFVIEFEKIDGPPGPPVDIRLTGEEIVKIVAPFGFQAKQSVSVGRFNSLTGFVSAIAG